MEDVVQELVGAYHAEYRRECSKIDDLAISEEFIRLPADFAYWSERYAEKKEAFMLEKHELQRLRAKLVVKHREELSLSNSRVTESMVTSAVDQDPTWHDQYVSFVKAEVACEKAKLFLETLRTKKDMLVSLGAMQRAEMKSVV